MKVLLDENIDIRFKRSFIDSTHNFLGRRSHPRGLSWLPQDLAKNQISYRIKSLTSQLPIIMSHYIKI